MHPSLPLRSDEPTSGRELDGTGGRLFAPGMYRGEQREFLSGGSLALLGRGSVENLLHAAGLVGVKLEVLGRFGHPGRVEQRRVLVHQVGVLGAPRAAKVLHLREEKGEGHQSDAAWSRYGPCYVSPTCRFTDTPGFLT